MGISITPRPTLVDLRLVGEYATNFRWNLKFPSEGLPLVFGGDGSVSREIAAATGSQNWRSDITNSIASSGNFFEKLNVLCESANLPSKTVEKMSVILRGHLFFQPGIVTPNSTLTLNFVENTENIVHHFFYAWQEAIWAMNLGVGVPYDWLVADKIELTRLDNADNPICTYNMRFCFLKEYTPGALSGNTSGPLTTSVSLSYDDFYVTNAGPAMDAIYRNGQLNERTI